MPTHRATVYKNVLVKSKAIFSIVAGSNPRYIVYVHVYIRIYTVRVKVPVQAPCTPRSAPVQAPFAIIGSPVRVLCGLPVFCTAEFLARAKLKSKAKKTTETLGSTQKNI